MTLAAIDAGEELVPVHVLPFRMTNENMTAQNSSIWKPFWNNLKEGYDVFERTKRPPMVGVCSGRYIFNESPAGALPGPLDACGPTLASIRGQEWLNGVPPATAIAKGPAETADSKAPPIPQIRTSLESETPTPMFSCRSSARRHGIRQLARFIPKTYFAL